VEYISNFSDAELLAAGVSSSVIADPNYIRMGTVIDRIDQFDGSFFGFNFISSSSSGVAELQNGFTRKGNFIIF